MYIDAKTIETTDGSELVYISQRNKEGERTVTPHMPPYMFYYVDKNGGYESIYGDPLKRKRFTNKFDFYKARKALREKGFQLFESDIKPHFRLLEEKFPTDDAPPLHISFFDIEADKDPKIGFSRVSNPYAIINAVTIHNSWEDMTYTIVVTPPNMTTAEARELLDSSSEEDEFGSMTEDDNYFLVESERDLLLAMIELFQDADVLTGWNSELFDIPYFIQRIRVALGGERLEDINREDGSERRPFNPSKESQAYLKQLNLFPCLPEMRMVKRFGKMEKAYDIFGRIHLDYLELYRKFTFEELHQYTLDFVLRKEIKESKVPLEEDLYRVYRYNLRTFTAYNRQDVVGMVKLDKKKKMIQLANSTAHMAGVTLDKTLGTVSITEQAILRRLHRKGQICFDKSEHPDTGTIPGAFVVKPEGGIYNWIFSVDINSLYPSIIRAINISPEVVIGQFDLYRTEAEWQKHFIAYGGTTTNSESKRREASSKAWSEFTGVLEYHMIIEETDDELTLYIEGDDEPVTASAKEWKRILLENNYCISANGTVFTLEREGIVAECMTDWYNERKEFQAKKKSAPDGSEEEEYWDGIQQVRKIFLNATYGAYLNQAFRFFDPRLGRSVTLSGRCITKHMITTAEKLLSGDSEKPLKNQHVIYGDTDSCYITMENYLKHNGIVASLDNANEIIKIADDLGDKINDSFGGFMNKNFLISEERGNIIRAGREIVADHGLFGHDVKKRYALHVIDNEGKRVDKMKVMGMETRRSDTPKYIQDFLEECLEDVVKNLKGFEDIKEKVEKYRDEVFHKLDPWKRGSPCRVSNLTVNAQKLENYEKSQMNNVMDVKKPTIHFSVAAANNTNHLMEINGETHWDFLNDGEKIEILELLENPYDIEKVAIRAGEVYVPEWFKKLPFNNAKHEHKLITRKLGNILGVLGWDFAPITDYREEELEEVDFFDDIIT